LLNRLRSLSAARALSRALEHIRSKSVFPEAVEYRIAMNTSFKWSLASLVLLASCGSNSPLTSSNLHDAAAGGAGGSAGASGGQAGGNATSTDALGLTGAGGTTLVGASGGALAVGGSGAGGASGSSGAGQLPYRDGSPGDVSTIARADSGIDSALGGSPDGRGDAVSGTGGTGTGGVDAGGAGLDGGKIVGCSGAHLLLSDPTNYAFASTLTLPPIAVAPRSDLTIDWSEVTADLRGQAVDPKLDLNTIAISMWNLTETALESRINTDTLVTREMDVIPATFVTDHSHTTTNLLSFSFNGNPIDPTVLMGYYDIGAYPPASHIYMVSAQTGTSIGQGTRMLQTFRLDAASTNTTVKLTNASTAVTFSANLHDLTPIAIPAGQASIDIDWSGLKLDARGDSFIALNITEAMVGHYPQSSSELEARFLDLERIASELYSGSIDQGTTGKLATLKTDKGKAFAGIDASGTWLLALRCDSCSNPAPLYLTILRPCAGG
jgi:hypothetical protein